jgi:hypothetical protein
MSEPAIEVCIYGDQHRVASKCNEFITLQKNNGELITQPNGRANLALQKAIFHTNDNGVSLGTDEAKKRMQRADALEEVFFVCLSMLKGHEVHAESAIVFAGAFGEVIRQAVYEEDEKKALALIKNAFFPAVSALRRKNLLLRQDAPRNKVHRVLKALAIGCRYYEENNFQRPSKQFIQRKLEEEYLGFNASTSKKLRQLWRTFWSDCGLSQLPEAEPN